MYTLRGRQTQETKMVSCEQLLQSCKQEAKQLLEATATSKKIHWTHPNFISFCLSVEDVLSYGVKRRYTSTPSSHRRLTSSGCVLKELSKVFPVARSIYQMCYGSDNSTQKPVPEYARIHGDTLSELKILWIRTSIIEKTMSAIIDQLLKKPELYYGKHSIMSHPVYSELFAFLMEGPCSISLSRMKILDTSILSPGPSELVSRHSKAIPSNDIHSNSILETPSSVMWQHVQSLYQSTINSCLFGKNNVLMQPPGLDHVLQGYLTLVEIGDTLYVKWLPNTLINGTDLNWVHVLSVDITHDVAHLHCHQGDKQDESELVMIGYNGIAYPSLKFTQPTSMLSFLDALENGLHPLGCLEPPLWFLRQQHVKSKPSGILRNIAIHGSISTDTLGLPLVWNQVFRVRYIRRKQNEQEPEWMESDQNMCDVSSKQSYDKMKLPPTRQTSRKYLLEKFQSRVSSQLLARYFYSWLSYCRHIAQVKKRLSHLIIPNPYLPPSPLTEQTMPLEYATKLDDNIWQKFINNKTDSNWQQVILSVYTNGIEHHLRAKVWPYILGLYPKNSSLNEQNVILLKEGKAYENILRKWKAIESQHYHNNDPTSTSLAIRQGITTSSLMKKSSSPTMPNLIELDVNESHSGSQMLSSEEEADDDDSGCEDLLLMSDRPRTSGSSDGGLDVNRGVSEEGMEQSEGEELSQRERMFLDELYKIDKDIPRCDRDYSFFNIPQNLTKLRNIVTSYVWQNLSNGYSQGMCDLLAPLLVIFEDEELTFACFNILMRNMEHCFPPKPGVSQRMANLQSLLQVLESDFFQYLCDQPMGDALFYTYRWFLVNFKREFSYEGIFLLWETSWAAKYSATDCFEVFFALALLKEYKTPIMDAQLDPSEILNLFTDLADKKALDCQKLIGTAQLTISDLQMAI